MKIARIQTSRKRLVGEWLLSQHIHNYFSMCTVQPVSTDTIVQLTIVHVEKYILWPVRLVSGYCLTYTL